MTSSIRTFLLINLLLSVTLITSLAIIGNLFLAHKDIQLQLDTQLIRNTLQMQALFADGVTNREIALVQQRIEEILDPTLYLKDHGKKIQNALNAAHQVSTFQVWNRKGKLLLRSLTAPNTPLSTGETGLSNLWLKGQSWRVYTNVDPVTHLVFMVGEQSNFRQKLENQLTQDSIFVMLITYPFLGLLIWIIVGRGLEPLKKIASEVSHRAPSHLLPVDAKAIPAEIIPVIEELNSLFQRLDDAFEREKRFAADAAHELKTPLAIINTQAQVALCTQDEEVRKQALQKLIKGIMRSTHIVQQLLTLSRMMPESTIKEPEEINLTRAATEIVADLAPQAIAKNIEIELIADETPILISGNSTYIAILMRNLVDNAIRYTPEMGTVTIQTEHTSTEAIFKVIDNGPGVPEELRERVFERFFRVVGNQASGSGLGLGIVQKIVRLHHAEISLATAPSGQGLEVKVSFPLL